MDWRQAKTHIQEAVRYAFMNRGVMPGKFIDDVLHRDLWQSMWLDTDNKLLALKPRMDVYEEFDNCLRDPQGIVPSVDEARELYETDSFRVYIWPSFVRVGNCNVEDWRSTCPNAIPVVEVPHWTRLWFKQKFGSTKK
jgi:hypothetical protein